MDGIEQKNTTDYKRYLLIGFVVIIGLALIGGGIWVSQKALKKGSSSEEATPTVAPEPTLKIEEITPTTNPALKRSELKIKVLNGIGVPGEAGKVADFLEEQGYLNVKTGNADNYDYQKITIQIKDAKKDFAALLINDLKSDYAVNEKITSLSADDSFDAVLILGKE